MGDDGGVGWNPRQWDAARIFRVRGETGRPGRAEARARRALGFAAGVGAVLWLVSHMHVIIQQDRMVQAWWTPTVVAGLLITGTGLVVASLTVGGPAVGRFAAWLATVMLAALMTLPIAGHYNCFGPSGTWIPPLVAATAVAGVLAWPRCWPVYLLVSGVIAAVIDAYVSGGTGIHVIAEDLVRTWGVQGFLTWTAARLLAAAIELDTVTAIVVRQATVAAGAEATDRERTRFAGLIHDNVLATLLDAARGGTAERLRRSARRTLRQLDTSPHEYRVEDTGEVREAIEALRAEAAEHGLPVTVDLANRARDLRIPNEVTTSLAGALGEAVRNSLRHAAPDGRAVTRTVRIAVDEGGVVVQIVDDGAGFEVDRIGVERLGVRQSILWRMRCLRGGDAQVDSAPGRGTTVTLRWTHTDPREPRPPALIGVRGLPGIVMMALLCWAVGMLLLGYVRGGDPVVACTGFGLVAAAGAVVLIPRDDPLPRAATWSVVAVGPLAASIVNLGPRAAHHAVWVIVAYSYVLALLAIRGRVAATCVALLAAGAAYYVAGGSPGAALNGTAVAGATVLAAVAFTLYMRPLLRSYHGARADIARHAGAEARAAAQSRERRSQMAYLSRTARPMLEFLAAGRPLSPQQVRECRLLEAELRDRLRAPGLADPALVRAARAARTRGVRLTLLDDAGPGPEDGELRAAIVETAVAYLDSVMGGRVTVRVLPPGRGCAATIVIVEPDTYRRVEIDAGGVPSATTEPATAG
ncbi:sensor histidine kinase [Nocardia miyunensis]|uniref:sensor histidine kinase n=1 Tax=Nocardia miyunensis TaxID=282684 RepID=UPI0012F4F690|nr:ATP-binding protein [Nocardia miyunensis]